MHVPRICLWALVEYQVYVFISFISLLSKNCGDSCGICGIAGSR